MEAFPSAKHLCSWAGLTPTNNKSTGKKKSARISKAGYYIKPLLVQCATDVVKSEKHHKIHNHYLHIKSVAATGRQSLLLQECFLQHYTAC
nr:transposase [Thermoanaerobacterium sp. CMT5567-10]